jgi:hypothetical protein
METLVKRIDNYDIYECSDGTYTVNAEEGYRTRLVAASLTTLKAAIRQVRIDLNRYEY